MAAETELYGLDTDKGTFFRLEGEAGGTLRRQDVSPEEALQAAAALYLSGASVYELVGGNARIDPSKRISEQFLVENFLHPGLALIVRRSRNLDEIIRRLRAAISDPRIINIMRVRGLLGEQTVRRVWPDLEQRLQNFAGPEVPNPPRANRIDGIPSTGPPAPGDERNTASRGNQDSGGQGTQSSPRSDSKTGGDPLLLASGQLYLQVTDLEVRGRGLHFAFIRTYLNQVSYKGPLGYCWDHSYNLWLREEQEILPDGRLVNVVYRSTGQAREDRYVQVLDVPSGDLPPLGDIPDAVFAGPQGFFERLEKSGGIYILEMPTGVRLVYNDDLYVERIVDLNGNELSFEYDPSTRLLITIRDPVGKEFWLDYDPLNRIQTLRDLTGDREVRYYYGDNGDLEEVDLALADFITGTDYRYSGPDQLLDLQHNLIEVISPVGQSILENEYGVDSETWGFNRVIRQRSEGGEFHYEYGPVLESPVDPALDPINVPQTFTRVTYPNGHCIEHWFNRQGNVVRREETIIGRSGLPASLVASYRYNEDGLLVEERRPDGSGTTYRYGREAYAELHGGDASGATAAERTTFGNLLRRVEAPRAGHGETRRIVTDYAYHPQGNRLASQRGPYYADLLLQPLPGQAIEEAHYEYDQAGNLVRIRYPDLERPDGTIQSPASPEFAYNRHGLITDSIVGPLHTQYRYFSDELRSGFVQEKIEDVDGVQRRTQYEVDQLRRTTRTIDSFGATTDVEWTAFDAAKRVVLPEVAPGTARPAISYAYNRSRQIARVEEAVLLHDGRPHPDGALVQTFAYDAYGRLVEHSLGTLTSSLRTRRLSYNPSGLIEREIDFLGNVTFTDYDTRLLRSAVTRGWRTPEQSTRRLHYDIAGELSEIVDGRGYSTLIEWDGFGRQRTVRDPDGNETETDYDAAGRAIRYRRFGVSSNSGAKIRWSETAFRYDAAGRLIERIDHRFVPDDPEPDTLLRTHYFYDPLNRIERMREPEGAEWQFAYDGLGRLTRLRDPDGNTTEWRYDDAERTLTTMATDTGTDEGGNPVTQVFRHVTRFDARGLPVEEIDGLGNTTSRGHDSRGQLTAVTDAGGQEFLTDYDIFGQPVAFRTRLLDHEVRRELVHDANGNLAEATSPVGGTTIWTYDSLNRISSVARESSSVSYLYDEEDNILLQRDENGIAIKRSYTPAGFLRLEEPDLSGFSPPPSDPSYTPTPTPPTLFHTTPLGTVGRAQNSLATVITRVDSLGRVVYERVNGRSVAFRFDNTGRQTGLVFPDGRDISFVYSPGGRITAIHQNAAGQSYPGDPSAPFNRSLATIWRVGDRPLTVRFGSSHQAKLAYDGAQRVVAMDWTRLIDGSALWSERTLHGSRDEWMLHQSNDLARLFSYDSAVRLVQASDLSGTAPVDVTGLTPAGSEAELARAATQANIDALLTELISEVGNRSPDRDIAYQLDDNDNRVSVAEVATPGGPPVTTSYAPDNQDRYQSVNGAALIYDRAGNLLDDGVNRYRYDAYNRLAEISTAVGTAQLHRDGLGRLSRIQSQSGMQEFTYAGLRLIEWRQNGTVVGQVVPLERPHQFAHLATVGRDSSPLFDLMDSVIGWLSPDGTINARTTYDPFGQVLQRDPNWPAPFGFAGYYYHASSQTYLLTARGYLPRLGRFLQRDPLGPIDGTNLYAYAHHAPGALTDTWGFASQGTNWGIVAWEASKTLAAGGGLLVGTALLVGLGVIEAPFLGILGLSALLHFGLLSFFNRSNEAIEAGKSDWAARGATAALLDTVGGTEIISKATGRDLVTGRPWGGPEADKRLGQAIGTAALQPLGLGFSRLTAVPRRSRARGQQSSTTTPSPQYQPNPVAQTPGPQGVAVRIRYTEAMAQNPGDANFLRFGIEWAQQEGVLLRTSTRSLSDAAARSRARRAMDRIGFDRTGRDAMHPVDSRINIWFDPSTGAYYFGNLSVNRSFGAQLGGALRGVAPGTPVRFEFTGFPGYDVAPPIAPPLPPTP